MKNQSKYLGMAPVGVFAALLLSCASDGNNDNTGAQNAGQQPGSATSADSELASKEAQLRAARESAGAAKAGAKGCFDAAHACVADGGVIDQACLDKLTACLPVAPPGPIGCPKLPEPTAEQIAAVDDAVGKADDLVGQAADFAGQVEDAVGPAIDDLAGHVEAVVGAVLDGGIPLPPLTGGSHPGASPSHNKNGGGAGGDAGVRDTFPPFGGDAGPRGTLPVIAPDASIGGGELCGIPLPKVPVGALKACADTAAAALKGGADLITVAESALACIEKPFEADIAQVCGEATSLCSQAGSPPNICAHVSEICAELTAP